MPNVRRPNLTWENAPDVLTVSEAAALLRVTPGAVYAAIRLGLVPAANFGKRQTRIAKRALREELTGGREPSRETAAFGHAPEANS